MKKAKMSIVFSSPMVLIVLRYVIETNALVNQFVQAIHDAPNDLLFKGRNSTQVHGTLPIAEAYAATEIKSKMTRLRPRPTLQRSNPTVIIKIVLKRMALLPKESMVYMAKKVNMKFVEAIKIGGSRGFFILNLENIIAA